MTRFINFEREERRRAGVSDAGHGFSPFLSDTDRKGGRSCRSLRCPVPQTRLGSTAGLEEPTHSVVGDRPGAKPRRTNHDDRLVDTGFTELRDYDVKERWTS